MAAIFSLFLFWMPLFGAVAEDSPIISSTMPEKMHGSHRRVYVEISPEKIKDFLIWLRAGHLAIDGQVLTLMESLNLSLENPDLAGCRVSEDFVSVSDSLGKRFAVERFSEASKGPIPKIEIITSGFVLACTKLMPGATFTWPDIVRSTQGLLQFGTLADK